jgi:ATP-dependent RNA helicase DeaD
LTVSSDFSAAHAALARALDEREYRQATPVQKAVLQDDARERDLLVSAQTGSGKTIAFGLAIADRLLEAADRVGPAAAPQALIIAPTRELALQVQRELAWLYQYTGARIVSCVGGMDPGRERRELSAGAHIVVGTPGRLRDHLERGALKVTAMKAVVLDEADEMLDMGFREDLEFILETTPPERQTLLFSATLPKTIVTLARHYQRDAFRIEALGESKGHADIEYRAVRVAGHRMEAAVVNFLRFLDPPAALVFCGTRERVRHMEAVLSERGFAAVSLSGELSQHERNHALQALRDGRARVCVATDVAARGIDLPSLNLVIHADLPNDAEVLQHRSGRTGRAGKKGISVLLVPPSRRRRAEEILGRARVNAVWGNPPTADEIRVLDRERLLNDPLLTDAPGDEDYALGDTLLEKHGVREIAAALAKVMRTKLPLPEEIEEESPYKSTGSRQDKPARGPKPEWKERSHDAPRPAHQEGRPAHKGPRSERPARDDVPRGATRNSDMPDGVWFRLNVGRERNADPKWLLPEICRQGDITKADVGPIRVEEMQTLFQISAGASAAFAEKIAARTKGGVRITPFNPAAEPPAAAVAAPSAPEAPRPARKPFYKEGHKEGHKGGKPPFPKAGKGGGKGGKPFKKWGKGPDAKPRKPPQG